MKIGINLVGISGGAARITGRDWTNTKDNTKRNVIECWRNDTTIVYLTTYERHPHPLEIMDCDCKQTEVEMMRKFYDAEKVQLLRLGKDKGTQRDTYIRSLKMWLDTDVDVIISTRFDIEFFDRLCDLNINLSKVNFLFKEGKHWYTHSYVTDNLFIIPKQYLPQFIEAVELLDEEETLPNQQHMHGTYRCLKSIIGTEQIHFISDNLYYSYNGGNPFYYLHRANGSHEISRDETTQRKEWYWGRNRERRLK